MGDLGWIVWLTFFFAQIKPGTSHSALQVLGRLHLNFWQVWSTLGWIVQFTLSCPELIKIGYVACPGSVQVLYMLLLMFWVFVWSRSQVKPFAVQPQFWPRFSLNSVSTENFCSNLNHTKLKYTFLPIYSNKKFWNWGSLTTSTLMHKNGENEVWFEFKSSFVLIFFTQLSHAFLFSVPRDNPLHFTKRKHSNMQKIPYFSLIPHSKTIF